MIFTKQLKEEDVKFHRDYSGNKFADIVFETDTIRPKDTNGGILLEIKTSFGYGSMKSHCLKEFEDDSILNIIASGDTIKDIKRDVRYIMPEIAFNGAEDMIIQEPICDAEGNIMEIHIKGKCAGSHFMIRRIW